MAELDILKNIIENKDKIFENINEAKEKLIPTVNITNILGCATDEVKNSSLLHNLLKIKFRYENKEINFAKDFSEYVIKEKLKNDSVDINSTAEAFNEFYALNETWRRIDLLIKSDNFEIIIENKIVAGDQENQLKDYYDNRIKSNKNKDKIKNNIFIVYLTTYGNKPSEFSINKELREDLENKNKICYLSHDDIAEWIENDILNKYQFLKEKEFQSIYSALIQIRDNEKIITNPSEEDNMQEKEIKKVLDEKLFKELESKGQLTKGKLNEYIEMFDKAKDLLEKQKIQILIKFTKEIANYLKSKNYKEGKDYTLLSDEDIINGMLKYNYPHPIEFNINNIRVSLEYEKYEGDMSCYFGIYTFNEDMPIKLREKFKASIESIFNYSNEYRNEYREEGAWIFIYYIDIEKDKSSKIAQAMIDLYELLKKEIK